MPGPVRFLLTLLVVFVVHLAGSAVPYFNATVDLFVVLILLVAARGDEMWAMFAGVAAGLGEDAVVGSLYGLHGFAGTLVGFAVARTARRLATYDASVVGLLAIAAQPLYEVVVSLLQQLLIPGAVPPSLPWVAVRSLTSAILAFGLFVFSRRFDQRYEDWQKTRVRKVKID